MMPLHIQRTREVVVQMVKIFSYAMFDVGGRSVEDLVVSFWVGEWWETIGRRRRTSGTQDPLIGSPLCPITARAGHRKPGRVENHKGT